MEVTWVINYQFVGKTILLFCNVYIEIYQNFDVIQAMYIRWIIISNEIISIKSPCKITLLFNYVRDICYFYSQFMRSVNI